MFEQCISMPADKQHEKSPETVNYLLTRLSEAVIKFN